MPTDLTPVLLRTPIADHDTLHASRSWQQWFIANFTRVGGERAQTNIELEAGIVGNSGGITQLETDLGTTNTTVAGLEGEVSTLQTAVLQVQADVGQLQADVGQLQADVGQLQADALTLRTDLDALTLRTVELETWRADVVAGLPAVVMVTPVPTLTDAPVTADALRDNLTVAWQGLLTTNDDDLETAVNALRAALATP